MPVVLRAPTLMSPSTGFLAVSASHAFLADSLEEPLWLRNSGCSTKRSEYIDDGQSMLNEWMMVSRGSKLIHASVDNLQFS
jgi:hypothetical protein